MRMPSPSEATAVADGVGAADRPRRAVKAGGEEPIAGRVDRLTPKTRELTPDDCVVFGQERRPGAARLECSRRRVDEIRKEDRREHAPPLNRPLLPGLDGELRDVRIRKPVEAPDLEDPAAGDLRRHVVGDLGCRRIGVVVEIGAAMDDQSRRLDGGERASHVDIHVHSSEREQRTRAHRESRCTRSLLDDRIGGRPSETTSVRSLELRAAAQFGERALGLKFVLLARRRPRKVRGADKSGFALEQDEGEDALGIRRREQDRERGAVDVAEQRGPLRVDSVHHRADVVHPLFE